MIFRPFKESDAKTIVSWITDEEEYHIWSADRLGEYPIKAAGLNSYVHSFKEKNNTFFFVGEDEDGIFGFLQIERLDARSAHFSHNLVDPSKRGRGYGKKFIELAKTYSTELLEVRDITIHFFEENKIAQRMFFAAGFIDTKKTMIITVNGEDHVAKEMLYTSPEVLLQGSNSDHGLDPYIQTVLDKNSLSYAYQPIVKAIDGRIYGYEALMRAEVDGKNISPKDILEYATKNNKLYEIEKATLFNVLDAYVDRKDEFKGRRIFVNSIPGYQLTSEDYELFRAMYRDFFNCVTVEITENTQFTGSELNSLFERSRGDGFNLAIDDYGTGYSNTTSLLECLPSVVKIDRLLISNINEDAKKRHFVKAMVEFAHTNGFLCLAEGVETSGELNTVVGMNIDLIQGFYTARPSFEILDEIDPDIQNEIINANHRSQSIENRKILVVNDEKELPLMRVSLEQYTGMLISVPEFTLVGNQKYCADMCIKIKDGTKCRLTLSEVLLESFNQLPCIELGNNCEVTLVLEGNNRLRKSGILVPESSKLILEGDGDLSVRTQGVCACGIGNTWDATFGSVTLNTRGAVDVIVEADNGIAIGGGKASERSEINILSGTVRLETACEHSVSIGCVEDSVPIYISDVLMNLEIKSDKGIGIGCGGMDQDTEIRKVKMNITAAGTTVACIGNVGEISGFIRIGDCEVNAVANGQHVFLIGGNSGDVSVFMKKAAINIRGEGNEVLGVGTMDNGATINSEEVGLDIKISAGKPITLGTRENLDLFEKCIKSTDVNDRRSKRVNKE